MINLIPPEARSQIVTEYWFRAITVWLFMVAVVAITMAALLLPAYVLVTSQVRGYQSSAAEAAGKVAQQENASKTLINTSTLAGTIVADASAQPLTEIFDVVESVIDPATVVVKGYSFVRTGGVISQVQVDGVATTRLALASFRDSLLKQPLIDKVDLPIANLAKDRDLVFSLTLTLTAASSTPAL